MERKRKQRLTVTIEEYLGFCTEEISLEEYLNYEKKRVKGHFKITPDEWIRIINNQKMKCYYCDTDLRIIQQLILQRIVKPRKRGPDGYSGLHFELDHKNCNKSDNTSQNIVASCYYCNNDKSDTFSCDIFKQYFGLQKNKAFEKLFQDAGLSHTSQFRHHLNGKNSL